jgi:hypothetical protein
MTGTASPQFRPAGSLNVTTALAPYQGPWNARLAAHLLRRAGFGGSPDEIARAAGMSLDAAVDGLIHYPKADNLPGAPDTLDDHYVEERRMLAQAGTRNADDASIQQIRAQIGKDRQKTNISMISWWTNRMIDTPAPLQEKMTLFWHGLFTTTVFQKGITPKEAVDQNWIFRNNALGSAREIAHYVSRDPAMLKYLDNARSNRAHPNENYARELMELFTLGIGNYTEADIRESARAFTGYSVCAAADSTSTSATTTTASRRSSARAETSTATISSRSSIISRPRRAGSRPSCSTSSSTTNLSRSSSTRSRSSSRRTTIRWGRRCRRCCARTCSTRIARIVRS